MAEPTALRTLTNKPGVTEDLSKTSIFFASDWTGIKNWFAYVLGLISLDGWNTLGACTYEGADAPSYTVSFASDMTAKLSPGMRIKLTDSTVKYFIITAVGTFSDGKTIITLYGGTDYTLSGGAITLPFYSFVKVPFGFPLSSAKWTVSLLDTSPQSQSSPSSNVWYNLGSLSMSLPIGAWDITYKLAVQIGCTVGGGYRSSFSTSNNSESDVQFTSSNNMSGTLTIARSFVSVFGKVVLTSKTTYYLIALTGSSGISTLSFEGGACSTVVKAVCAYL